MDPSVHRFTSQLLGYRLNGWFVLMDKAGRRRDAVVRHGAEGITGASGGGGSLCQGIWGESSGDRARSGKRDSGRGCRWGCKGAGGMDRATRKGAMEAKKVTTLGKRHPEEGEAASRRGGGGAGIVGGGDAGRGRGGG